METKFSSDVALYKTCARDILLGFLGHQNIIFALNDKEINAFLAPQSEKTVVSPILLTNAIVKMAENDELSIDTARAAVEFYKNNRLAHYETDLLTRLFVIYDKLLQQSASKKQPDSLKSICQYLKKELLISSSPVEPEVLFILAKEHPKIARLKLNRLTKDDYSYNLTYLGASDDHQEIAFFLMENGYADSLPLILDYFCRIEGKVLPKFVPSIEEIIVMAFAKWISKPILTAKFSDKLESELKKIRPQTAINILTELIKNNASVNDKKDKADTSAGFNCLHNAWAEHTIAAIISQEKDAALSLTVCRRLKDIKNLESDGTAFSLAAALLEAKQPTIEDELEVLSFAKKVFDSQNRNDRALKLSLKNIAAACSGYQNIHEIVEYKHWFINKSDLFKKASDNGCSFSQTAALIANDGKEFVLFYADSPNSLLYQTTFAKIISSPLGSKTKKEVLEELASRHRNDTVPTLQKEETEELERLGVNLPASWWDAWDD